MFVLHKKPGSISSKIPLLTKAPWILTHESKIDGEWRRNASFDSRSPCLKDDAIRFRTDFKYENHTGAIKCSSTPDVFVNGTWSLEEKETILKYGNSSFGYESWSIFKLDESTLQLTATV
ncbi:MAG TPA: lipocalin family protein [Segetibacter sp.]|jgi:hypothetical protein